MRLIKHLLIEGDMPLNQSFSSHAHNGRIKQVVVNGNFLISGGTDEYIRIFDLKNRKEIGNLYHHEGTITALIVHKGFLFSGAEDGKIGIYKIGKWEVVHSLVGHTSEINSIAIHPSGKLALSVSKDKKMITWDLTKGKRAYISGFREGVENVLWTLSGTHYITTYGSNLNVFSMDTGSIIFTADLHQNINAVLFISEDKVALGGEEKTMFIYNIKTDKVSTQWEAHNNRVKSLSAIDVSHDIIKYIASSSSDGFIKIWKILAFDLRPNVIQLMGKIDTKCRIICMAIRIIDSNILKNENATLESIYNLNNSLTSYEENNQLSGAQKNKSKKLNGMKKSPKKLKSKLNIVQIKKSKLSKLKKDKSYSVKIEKSKLSKIKGDKSKLNSVKICYKNKLKSSPVKKVKSKINIAKIDKSDNSISKLSKLNKSKLNILKIHHTAKSKSKIIKIKKSKLNTNKESRVSIKKSKEVESKKYLNKKKYN